MRTAPEKTDHVRGLDSIRFLCALWVFFGHGASPALANPFASDSLAGTLLRGIYNNLWSVPAAVIIFFIISGFCIHFPYANSNKTPQLKEFYARRFLRLLVPVAAAIPLSGALGIELSLLQQSILWSLFAELIYYILYPLLRAIHLWLGSWTVMLCLSFVMALGVAATSPFAGNYPSYGSALNWLLAFPCWILGCALAETVRRSRDKEVTKKNIWSWRAAVFAAAWVCSVFRFHSPLGYPWTLNFFALLAAMWLLREISFRKTNEPSRILEWLGSWSYSLYLVHLLGQSVFKKLFPLAGAGLADWGYMVSFVLATSYLFYVCVEFPSHALARFTAKKLRSLHSPPGVSV